MAIQAKISAHCELHPAFEKYRDQPGKVISFSKERGKAWDTGSVILQFEDGRKLGFPVSDIDLIDRKIIRYCDVDDYHEFVYGRGSPC